MRQKRLFYRLQNFLHVSISRPLCIFVCKNLVTICRQKSPLRNERLQGWEVAELSKVDLLLGQGLQVQGILSHKKRLQTKLVHFSKYIYTFLYNFMRLLCIGQWNKWNIALWCYRSTVCCFYRRDPDRTSFHPLYRFNMIVHHLWVPTTTSSIYLPYGYLRQRLHWCVLGSNMLRFRQ